MTKKHYEAIASILFENGCDIDKTITIAKDLADYFATENPRFNRARFLEACGIQQVGQCNQAPCWCTQCK